MPHNMPMDIQNLPRERVKENHQERVISPPPPTSSTSSPSHEFSFTISLHPYCNSTPSTTTTTTTTNQCSKTSPSFEIDLAPADDIFFHGHLLPLHFLSHPTISPRPSDISIDDPNILFNHHHKDIATTSEAKRTKPKSITSLLGLKNWRKGSEAVEEDDKEKRKKKWFVVSQFLMKKYTNMVMFLKGDKDSRRDMSRRRYSFSGNLNPKGGNAWKKRKGEFSVPVSMRTSPTNSGLLLATPTALSSSNESTMVELQSAIQAAIAHCKNSTSAIKEEACKM